METVVIEAGHGSFTLEVGENSRAFLWLFHLTQNELVKSEMNAAAVADRLVKLSGSDPGAARAFAAAVAEMAEGREPERDWGLWAGVYARKFAAEKCKRDIRMYLLVFLGGLAASGFLSWSSTRGQMEDLLEVLLLVLSLVTVFGFFKALMLTVDWFSLRDSVWPERNDKTPAPSS